MLNALEKVMYPNGKTKALGDITSGSVSSIIDEVHTNTSAISAINEKLAGITKDPAKYTISPNLQVDGNLSVYSGSIVARDLKFELMSNAGYRNSIYRGKSLGTSVSEAQWITIRNGDFDNMFIGDYWTINGVNWRIAGFDYWLGCGSVSVNDHHVVIVPDTTLDTAKMNDTDIVTGGYYGSKMRGGNDYPSDGNINTAFTLINTVFSGHVLTHPSYLTTQAVSGKASGWGEVNATVDLMSEVMVYGEPAWSAPGTGYEVGVENGQLPLFRLDKSKIKADMAYWLRGIYSDTAFCAVSQYANTSGYPSSNVSGIRPAFAIYNPTTQQNTTTRKKATAKKKGE